MDSSCLIVSDTLLLSSPSSYRTPRLHFVFISQCNFTRGSTNNCQVCVILRGMQWLIRLLEYSYFLDLYILMSFSNNIFPHTQRGKINWVSCGFQKPFFPVHLRARRLWSHIIKMGPDAWHSCYLLLHWRFLACSWSACQEQGMPTRRVYKGNLAGQGVIYAFLLLQVLYRHNRNDPVCMVDRGLFNGEHFTRRTQSSAHWYL